MKDHTKSAKIKVNSLSAEALELQQQFECAINLANRHQTNFNASGDNKERKNAMSWNAKAWKLAKRIIAVKENLHWEASALAKAQKFLLESAENDIEQAHIFQSNAEYYDCMSAKAKTEADDWITRTNEVFKTIKMLRAKAEA